MHREEVDNVVLMNVVLYTEEGAENSAPSSFSITLPHKDHLRS
jgi:hypothetical protein